MNEITEVIFLRHGKSVIQENRELGWQMNNWRAGLCQEGMEQPAIAAKIILKLFPDSEFVLKASPILRAKQTAVNLKMSLRQGGAKAHGPIFNANLMELDLGSEHNPNYHVTNELYDDCPYANYWKRFHDNEVEMGDRPIDGQSFAELKTQAGIIAEEIKKYVKTNDLTCVGFSRAAVNSVNGKKITLTVVAHGLLLGCVFAEFGLIQMNKPTDRMVFDNSQPYIIGIDKEGQATFSRKEELDAAIMAAGAVWTR